MDKLSSIPILRIGGSRMDLNVGEIIKLKKQHPCGSSEWEILRTGMDFRLKCMGCEHQIMIPRKQVEKSIRQVRRPIDESNIKS
jgi:hypothetical protein